MAISLEAVTQNQETTATSLTFSHTTTGSNRRLYVGVSGDVTNDRITGVTYGGTGMTLVGKQLVSGNRYIYLWSLNNPSSGANNVVVSANASCLIRATAVSYTGCSQVSADDASTTNSGSSTTSLTTSVTTVADNCWAVVFGQNSGGSNIAAGTGATIRGDAAHDYSMFDSNGALTPAGSKSMQFTWTTAQNSGAVMASFAPVIITQTLTETPSVSDALAKGPLRTLSEAPTIVDTIKRTISRLFSETPTVADTLDAIRIKVLTLLESLLSDDGDNVVANGLFELAPPFTAPQTTSARWIDGTATGSTTRQPYAIHASFGGAAGDRNAQFDTANAHNGNNALKVHINSGAYSECRVNATTYTVADGKRLAPNTQYQYSAWMKSENVTGSSTGQHIQLLFADATGAAATLTSPSVVSQLNITGNVAANRAWTQYTGTFTTGANVAWFHPEYRVYGHVATATLAGDFWFDDVIITQTAALSFIYTLSRILSESFSLMDMVSRSMQRLLTDATTLLDSALRLPGRILSEGVTLLDTVRRVPGKVLSESVSLVQAITKATVRALTDPLTLTALFAKAGLWMRTFVESMSVSDRLRSLLNGLDARFSRKYPSSPGSYAQKYPKKGDAAYTKKYPDGT